MSKIIGVTAGTPTSPAKMEQELKPVKTVNGVAPDESGNVVVECGASAADLQQHIDNQNNPHGVTPEQIGARPNTWTPTAEQIGAATEAFAKAIGLPCYGELSFDIDETMPSQGVYRLNDSYGVNGINAGFFIQLGQYEDYNTRYGLQIACDFLGRICVRSRWYDGYINEWDWVNPQMSPGVEYRTTERWNGNPVFTKLIDFGRLPNKTEKHVSCGFPEGQVISFVGIDGTIYNHSSDTYIGLYAPKNVTTYTVNNGAIVMYCETDRSDQTAKITVKYIKQ